MSLPFILANLAAGNQPLSDIDANFNAVAQSAVTACTAVGTNTIALTPIANQATVATLRANQFFSFIAAATTTGPATVNVNALGAINLYLADGITQATTGNVVISTQYLISYDASLNSAAGGYRIVGATTTGAPFVTIKRQIFNTPGVTTYNPSTGMLYCIIEAAGGASGGGGVAGTAGFSLGGAGGGAGGNSLLIATAATIGASKVVTIGAAGAGGAAGSNPGAGGGDTSVGTICIAKGSTNGGGATTNAAMGAGGPGGVAGTGDITTPGMPGSPGNYVAGNVNVVGANGGSGPFGAGGVATGTNTNGPAGTGFGAGGAGGSSQNSASNFAGGPGTAGYVIITEYCSQ